MITLPKLQEIKTWAEEQPARTVVGTSSQSWACPISRALKALRGGEWHVNIDLIRYIDVDLQQYDENDDYLTPPEIEKVVTYIDYGIDNKSVPSYPVTREHFLHAIAYVQDETSEYCGCAMISPNEQTSEA